MNAARTNTMKWLIKREFWEHKGGFFWAPVIAAGIYMLMAVLATVMGHQAVSADPQGFHSGLAQMVHDASDPSKAREVSAGVEVGFTMLASLPLIVGTFVVFFYCLSCLYDERKDKSILFWKSLPLSDRDSVLAKIASAMLVAPAIATAVAIACALGLVIIASLFVLAHGQNPLPLWNLSGMAAACANLIVTIPVTALWALPTIGWLMLCSAWSRRVPFLWATLVPIVGGIMLAISGLMRSFGSDDGWYWRNIVGRILGGLAPAAEKFYRYGDGSHALPGSSDAQQLGHLFSVGDTLRGLANPELWIGVVAGVAMLVVATRLRRWRDEG